MKLYSLLKGVSVQLVASPHEIANPIFSNDFLKVNQHEASIVVEGVGHFYVRDGRAVDIYPCEDAGEGWLQWTLNSHVLVALLHQRTIIHFHASAFTYRDKGILILGEAGAGKSSVTAAFSLDGAGFLSDDLTPVIFNDQQPFIWPLYRQINLRRSALEQLNLDPSLLKRAGPGTGKYPLAVRKARVSSYPLHVILKLEIGEGQGRIQFHEPRPDENFALLRSEICSWEMLRGMPETEKAYLQQVIEIVRHVHMVRVTRSSAVSIPDMHEAITMYLRHIQ